MSGKPWRLRRDCRCRFRVDRRDCRYRRRFCSPRLSYSVHPTAVARLRVAETVRARPDDSAPWVVSVDADEWLDDDLRASLPRLMAADESVSGWKVRRSLTLYGQAKPVSRWTRPEHILRLVRRGRARFDPALIVHEGLVADQGETPIAHDGLLRHERSLPLNEQMKKEITYARLKAEQRLKLGRKPSTLKLVFNPPIYFLRIFFWNRFFLCGWAGFIHAGDRRHVFSHDRIDPSAIVLRSSGALSVRLRRRGLAMRSDEAE